jgi:hypothetical protein
MNIAPLIVYVCPLSDHFCPLSGRVLALSWCCGGGHVRHVKAIYA